MSTSIRVLLIEDHAIFRLGLHYVLDHANGIEVVGEAQTLAQGLQLLQDTEVDVVVLDLHLPDASGMEVLTRVADRLGDAALMVVSGSDGSEWAERVLAAGGHGYVDKSAQFPELVAAVRAVHAGRRFVSVVAGDKIVRRDEAKAPAIDEGKRTDPSACLSTRELEVLTRVARGQTNKEAAEELFLSVKTVETYRSRLMRKLGISGRSELFRYARDSGLLSS